MLLLSKRVMNLDTFGENKWRVLFQYCIYNALAALGAGGDRLRAAVSMFGRAWTVFGVIENPSAPAGQ